MICLRIKNPYIRQARIINPSQRERILKILISKILRIFAKLFFLSKKHKNHFTTTKYNKIHIFAQQ